MSSSVEKQGGMDHVPAWDGSARTWRRYLKEVQWLVLGTKPSLRRYLASRLISKLSGSARLLAMTWQLNEFNNVDGVKVFLSKLSRSPLVRKSLPNAASIMGQYFSFRRQRGEGIAHFLIREALHYEEFRECIIRLKEEQLGVDPERNGFGLPPLEETSDGPDDKESADETERDSPAGPPERRPYARVPTQDPGEQSEETVLSMADSFILEQLRGWRLLTSASLTSEEWRDVLGTTQGKLDYASISDALQVLYDEQMLGAGRQHGAHLPGGPHQALFQEFEEEPNWHAAAMSSWDDGYWHDDGWQDASWSLAATWDDSSWNDESWWESMANQMDEGEMEQPGGDPGLPDASSSAADIQKMEQMLADGRSWSQAHRATQAIRKDRGFGRQACWICGSTQHLSRECPDKNAPWVQWKGKGKGKKNVHWAEEEWTPDVMAAFSNFLRSKGKGKGKEVNFTKGNHHQQQWKGKGKGKPPVNAYTLNSHNAYGLEMEIVPELTLASTTIPSTEDSSLAATTKTLSKHGQPAECGMIDSGATCSAGPESSVQRLVAKILEADASASIHVETRDRPRFRFGSGKWVQACYKTKISSTITGRLRTFTCYALPDPDDRHESWFTVDMLVPVLVGMDWLRGVGAIIDFSDGHCCLPHLDGLILRLPENNKGHFMLDVLDYLTEGKVNRKGNAAVHVCLDDGSEKTSQTADGQTLELFGVHFADEAHEVQLTKQQTSPSSHFQSMVQRRLAMSSAFRLMGNRLPTASSWTTSSSRHVEDPDRAALGRDSQDGVRSTGPQNKENSVAMSQHPPCRQSSKQSMGKLDQLHSMRTPIGVHPEKGCTGELHGVGKPRECGKGLERTTWTSTSWCRTNGGTHEGDDREGDRRRTHERHVGGIQDQVAEEHGDGGEGEGLCEGKEQVQSWSKFIRSGRRLSRQLENRIAYQGRDRDRHGPSHSRGEGGTDEIGKQPCSDTDDCDQRHGVGTRLRPESVKMPEKTGKMPLRVGKGVMLMAMTMVNDLHFEMANLVYGKTPVVWEMFCSPESELTTCVNREGLCGVRINLAGGYDLYKDHTYERLGDLWRVQRPKKYWVSTPCTAHCGWSDLNYADRPEQLEERRRKERKMHKKMIKFLGDRLQEDEDAELYWEWPRICRGWKEEHIEKFREFLEKVCGRPVYDCLIDGCRYGMLSREGNPVKKSWRIMTTDHTFYATFRLKLCLRQHTHQQIHGVETNRSAYYPSALCRSIAKLWRKSLVPERWTKMLATAPIAMDPFTEAFAVEDKSSLCPGEFEPDLFAEDEELIPADEHEPSPEEKKVWSAKLDRFHRAAGHPTSRNLARMLADAQLPKWKIKMALEHQCPVCQECKPGGISSKQINPATTRELPAPWDHLGIDAAEWEVPGVNLKLKFVLLMDLSTKYKVTETLFQCPHCQVRVEKAEDMIRTVALRWLSDKPRPKVIIPDNAKSLTSAKFCDYMGDLGIIVSFPPDHESWAHGLVERGIQVVKETASRIHLSMPDQDPIISLALATAAVNATEYVKGYSSIQWVFGRQAEFSDEELRQQLSLPFERQEDQFVRLINQRTSAEEHARKARASTTLSKLKNTTIKQPLRTFQLSQPVMVWRKFLPFSFHQGKRGGTKRTVKARWIGPGFVVLHELVPGQGEGDRVPIVWVVIGSTLYRCSVHSVRPLSEREQAFHDATSNFDPNKWKQLSDIVPRREYVDIEHEKPQEEETEEFDLPEHPPDSLPPSTTLRVPAVRFQGKSTPDEMGFPDRGGQTVNDYGPRASSSSSSIPTPVLPGGDQDGEPEELLPELPQQDRRQSITSATPMLEPQREPPDRDDQEPIEEPEAKRARYEDGEISDADTLFLKHQMIFESVESGYLMNIDLEFTSNRQKKMFKRNPQLYLAKKMSGAEVVYRKLTSEEKKLFDNAMGSEVSSFLKTEAVRRCMNYEERQQAKQSGRILKSRWVLVWKGVPEESREEAIKDAQENEKSVHTKDGTRKAKARIVVLGYQHPDLLDPSLATTAPVQSQLVRNLSLCVVAQRKWQLEGLDMSTAFLQTGKTEEKRHIWMQGIPELNRALGAEPSEAIRILKNVYGNATAPRGLWEDVDKTFRNLGGRRLIGDSSFWVFTKPNPSPRNEWDKEILIGFIGGHVDDFNRAGDLTDPAWCKIRSEIDKSYKWGTTKVNQYRHTGLDLNVKYEGDDYVVEVDQNFYAEALPDLSIEPERLRRTDNPQLTPDEVSACRAGLGAIQWTATQTQLQACARSNLLLSQLTADHDMNTAREIQDLIKEIRSNPVSLKFWHLPSVQHWQDATIITLADQAHANRPSGDSTGGLLTLMGGPEHQNGATGRLSIVGWKTWKLKRKAISTNDGEIQSMLEGEDINFRTRFLWSQINGCRCEGDMLNRASSMVRCVGGIVGTDSKGGFDAVTRSEGPMLGLTNARSALQAYQLREQLDTGGARLIWLAGDWNLSDAFTKKALVARQGLMQFLRNFLWRLHYDPQFITSERKSKQLGKGALRQMKEMSALQPYTLAAF